MELEPLYVNMSPLCLGQICHLTIPSMLFFVEWKQEKFPDGSQEAAGMRLEMEFEVSQEVCFQERN